MARSSAIKWGGHGAGAVNRQHLTSNALVGAETCNPLSSTSCTCHKGRWVGRKKGSEPRRDCGVNRRGRREAVRRLRAASGHETNLRRGLTPRGDDVPALPLSRLALTTWRCAQRAECWVALAEGGGTWPPTWLPRGGGMCECARPLFACPCERVACSWRVARVARVPTRSHEREGASERARYR